MDETPRVVIIGITGQDWQPVAESIEYVCRYMLMPFSKDQPETDREIFGNICEYALAADEMQGKEDGVIAGKPTIVFCVPGIDRRRRMKILTEALNEVAEKSNFDLEEIFLFKDEHKNKDALFATIIEARGMGFEAVEIDGTEDAQEKVANWLVSLDPESD